VSTPTEPLHGPFVSCVGDVLVAMQLDAEVVADLLVLVHARRPSPLSNGIDDLLADALLQRDGRVKVPLIV
jgi:hypothetical protein